MLDRLGRFGSLEQVAQLIDRGAGLSQLTLEPVEVLDDQPVAEPGNPTR